jgi:hypothetical protein
MRLDRQKMDQDNLDNPEHGYRREPQPRSQFCFQLGSLSQGFAAAASLAGSQFYKKGLNDLYKLY